MVGQIINHAELDLILDQLAQNPETFAAEALKLAEAYDSKGVELEITNPESWRKHARTERDTSKRSVENQLRSEIEDIKLLDRADETRLARRVEFARLRLNRALEVAGLKPEALEGQTSWTPSTYVGGAQLHCSLPPRICRRWVELHALRTEMVERNLYLVLINVERYAHTSASRLDLIQEGSAALFRAVDGFDWRRGLLFRTYAVHWLNQAFRSYLYNFNATVRVPVYLQKALKHVLEAKVRLRDKDASPQAIAELTGLGEHIVTAALSTIRSTHSIDAPIGSDEDGGALRDLISVPDHDPYSPALEDTSLEDGIHDALDRLSDRERYVVSLRFGLDEEREHTLAEVADKLGVSLERVRQIQVRAITKMRTPALRKVVDPFLN